MKFDYHMHTPLCGHASGEPREYVLAAQKAGLDEIGFADHNPMPTQFDEWRMAPEEFEKYLEMVMDVQKEFADFSIKLGLECDFIPGYESHIEMLAQKADWDYFIGSVHYISPTWDVDNPKHLQKWEENGSEEIWTQYFDAYKKMTQSGLYDFFAHPDLVKKFGILPEGDLTRFYKDTIESIADHGGVIELNTAGLRKDCKEIYPSKAFLELAHKKHIPILINSDAHKPSEVGFAYDEALSLAKEVGYRELVSFEKRKRKLVKL